MKDLTIGLVGPCAAGKTTLTARLKELGYRVRHIAQEHSYVPYMWKRIANPDVLIYLDVSYEYTLLRRSLTWSRAEYEEQVRRLQHARRHATLYINTDDLTSEEVLLRIRTFVKSQDQSLNGQSS